jgi:hypothetical protein
MLIIVIVIKLLEFQRILSLIQQKYSWWMSSYNPTTVLALLTTHFYYMIQFCIVQRQ